MPTSQNPPLKKRKLSFKSAKWWSDFSPSAKIKLIGSAAASLELVYTMTRSPQTTKLDSTSTSRWQAFQQALFPSGSGQRFQHKPLQIGYIDTMNKCSRSQVKGQTELQTQGVYRFHPSTLPAWPDFQALNTCYTNL